MRRVGFERRRSHSPSILVWRYYHSATRLTFYNKHAFRDTGSFRLHLDNNFFLPNFKLSNSFILFRSRNFKPIISHTEVFWKGSKLVGYCKTSKNYIADSNLIKKMGEKLKVKELQL